jgi:hypothetical protein
MYTIQTCSLARPGISRRPCKLLLLPSIHANAIATSKVQKEALPRRRSIMVSSQTKNQIENRGGNPIHKIREQNATPKKTPCRTLRFFGHLPECMHAYVAPPLLDRSLNSAVPLSLLPRFPIMTMLRARLATLLVELGLPSLAASDQDIGSTTRRTFPSTLVPMGMIAPARTEDPGLSRQCGC